MLDFDRRGAIVSVGAPLAEPVPPSATLVKVPVACERGGFTLVAAATDDGRLASLQLAPPEAAAPTAEWEPPASADPDAFTEEEVTLESGPRAVGGTLTLPRAAGPRAGIVLLAGSAQPLQRAVLRQARHLTSLSPGDATAAESTLAEQVERVDRDLAGDLPLWRAAVPEATIRVYPAFNHLFVPGEDPSSPAEYERAAHVDPVVIDDIAHWPG